MTHYLCVLALSLLLAAPAWAEDIQEKLDLSGYWEEGGKVYRVQQAGADLRGWFHRDHSRCTKEGDLYFKGTLGLKTGNLEAVLRDIGEFRGHMLVCNPELCVDAGKIDPTRWTEFQFTVSQDCQTISGQWLWNGVRYQQQGGQVTSCQDSGQTEWRQDFRAQRLPSCASVERARQTIAGKKRTLEVYRQYQARFANGAYTVDENGAVRDAQGRVVARDFEGIQDLVLGAVAAGSPGGARVAGGITHFDIEEAVAGTIPSGQGDPCWCQTSCQGYNQCQDPWLLEECQGHEQKHCDHVRSICQQVRLARSPQDGAAIWNRWANDYLNHVNEEIAHYQWGIRFLEDKINSAGTCY